MGRGGAHADKTPVNGKFGGRMKNGIRWATSR